MLNLYESKDKTQYRDAIHAIKSSIQHNLNFDKARMDQTKLGKHTYPIQVKTNKW